MANPWRQSKLFICVGCGAELLHDRMHGHWAFRCPDRPTPAGPRPLNGDGLWRVQTAAQQGNP